MQLRLHFLGAAQNVTGSRFLLEANGCNLLVDCGLYQERDFQARNWAAFVKPPNEIDAVFITHAHLDHCGLLPKLVREGFSGPIYCTEATSEIVRIILLDAARLQEEDARFKIKRHKKEGRQGPFPIEPLYTTEDAEACFPYFTPLSYGGPIRIRDGIAVKLYEAGHVMGSSVVKITVSNESGQRSVLFSGDIGRPHRPIVRDSSVVHAADYVLIESTYGNREHHLVNDIKQHMAQIINDTVTLGGNILVPSFALERAQEVLYYVNELQLEGAIPQIRVFLDSPMATGITKIFAQHPELFDRRMSDHVRNHESPFKFAGLQLVETKKESQAINDIKGPIMIVAGSGMCTGGRIKHHLARHVNDPRHTIMFVGYQAAGTLGRRLVDGEEQVRILGLDYPVTARVEQVHGFSAHADKNELLDWLQGLEKPPRTVFVVHGEPDSARDFKQTIEGRLGWTAQVPAYRDMVELL